MENYLTVSVAMTTYNSEKFVEDQLKSIILQTQLPEELVIFDDHSKDHTVDVLKKFASTSPIPVHIYINETNLGYMKNFQECFKHCVGDIIISCDADDVWRSNKIEAVKREFSSTDVTYVYSNAVVVDADLNVISEYLYPPHNSEKWNDKEDFLLRCVRRQGFPYGMTMAFRRKLLDIMLPFEFAFDEWVAMCAPLYGTIRYIDEPLVYYRRHGHNTSGSNGESIIKQMRKSSINAWFDWPDAFVKSYLDYRDRFISVLPETVLQEIDKQVIFRKQLSAIISRPSKTRKLISLLRSYDSTYKYYRGDIKTLLSDAIKICIG